MPLQAQVCGGGHPCPFRAGLLEMHMLVSVHAHTTQIEQTRAWTHVHARTYAHCPEFAHTHTRPHIPHTKQVRLWRTCFPSWRVSRGRRRWASAQWSSRPPENWPSRYVMCPFPSLVSPHPLSTRIVRFQVFQAKARLWPCSKIDLESASTYLLLHADRQGDSETYNLHSQSRTHANSAPTPTHRHSMIAYTHASAHASAQSPTYSPSHTHTRTHSQIYNETEKLARGRRLKIHCLTKATASRNSFGPESSQKFDLLVSTPMRLVAMIKEDSIRLNK